MNPKSLVTKLELLEHLDSEQTVGRLSHMHRGVPAYLQRSVSQYSGLGRGSLHFENFMGLYQDILDSCSEISDSSVRQFGKENGLSFFGYSQYTLLKDFVLKNSV